MKNNRVRQLTISALLIAMGILIPMVMPKIVIGPASFTLASHVPLMIAMFFSPGMAVAVALGTAFGFLLTTPIIIAARALSHVVFAVLGAWYLKKNPDIVLHKGAFQIYNLVIALIHTSVEVIVVWLFFATGHAAGATVDGNFYVFLFGLMGIGGMIHSFVDYNIALFVVTSISKIVAIPVFQKAKQVVQKS
jgi:niacin transporter